MRIRRRRLATVLRLRMQETGMIKSRPEKIIAEGTDWRFLGEFKRELKT
jgi:NitT/TauT family transport system substrate-binding protein